MSKYFSVFFGLLFILLSGLMVFTYMNKSHDYLMSEALSPVHKINNTCSAVAIRDGTELLTAAHCIDEKTGSTGSITVGKEGKNQVKIPYYLVKIDRINDIALLKISDTKFRSEAVMIFDSTPAEGDKVYVVGYPSVVMRILTEGYFAGTFELTGMVLSTKFYMTSAPIYPGNSGGALFVKDGDHYRLIGITSQMNRNYHHMSLFVPLERIKIFLGE